jgi:HD-like signal output (HDOD) protein
MANETFDSFANLQAQLLARMNERGDLPGFSHSVQSIVNVLADSSGDDRDDIKLIQVVLTDASLTQKVLRLANSAMYAVFEGQVTTVSRAIAILGIQTVAHLALGLKVVESFQSDDQTGICIKGEMQKSMLAGVLGRQFAACAASTRDAEEASVCSVLHGLGRMLVAFYLPEAWAAVQKAAASGKLEDAAARDILCVGYEQIGQFIATRWGLPPTLVSALRPAPEFREGVEFTHSDWLCTVGTAATRGAHILHESSSTEESPKMTTLIETFAPRLGVDPAQLRGAIASARHIIQETMSVAPVAEKAVEQNRDRALAAGLEELRNAAKTATLSQTVAQSVEFLHQTLGSTRSFYFLKATKERMYKARLGLGKGAVELLPSLKFEEQFKPDVFHAAMASEKSCYVENSKSPAIKFRLPMWWMATLGAAQSFCIVPMNSNRVPLGFIYLEWAAASQSKKLEGYALEVLGEVRGIIAQSIERSRQTNAMAMQAVPT